MRFLLKRFLRRRNEKEFGLKTREQERKRKKKGEKRKHAT